MSSINNEERRLIEDLFRRIRSADGPRDSNAEEMINNAVRVNPSAPYYLVQLALVQEEALKIANQKITDLQARIEQNENSAVSEKSQSRGFLSGFGSLFGNSNTSLPPSSPSMPSALPASPPPVRSPSSGSYSSPWGQPYASPQMNPPPVQQGFGGGGFLASAMSTATGVAGGMLLAEGIKDLFSGGHHSEVSTHTSLPIQDSVDTQPVSNDDVDNNVGVDYDDGGDFDGGDFDDYT
ncbi:hypothetical protein B488_03600 [Liberibacter crescens BT-1]|uniref:DUF2076 domain-containing protein n=1 Tax=Liberibacter crescens (strain BT-1) TaxID=1215343 RepID=L0EUK3_LIBCB|nr:DUF2076 domain-containing protein [Liberibacter crescens]AGA64353.1 hypothetical protein B488_03600 [Liberibacter crescens BT-1]